MLRVVQQGRIKTPPPKWVGLLKLEEPASGEAPPAEAKASKASASAKPASRPLWPPRGGKQVRFGFFREKLQANCIVTDSGAETTLRSRIFVLPEDPEKHAEELLKAKFGDEIQEVPITLGEYMLLKNESAKRRFEDGSLEDPD